MKKQDGRKIWNPAVITPYHDESESQLERCHLSVLAQVSPSTHFLVADGSPRSFVDQYLAKHIVLPCAHNDYGNTPRAIGALSAINQGFNPILFLDADNWFASDHVRNALLVKEENPRADVIASMRQLVLPDGTYVEPDAEDLRRSHVDTSCLAMFESSFFLLPLWATMTKPLSVIGDRVMFQAFKKYSLSLVWTNARSLYYSTNYEHHWRIAGKHAPSSARTFDASILRHFSARQFYDWTRLHLNLDSSSF